MWFINWEPRNLMLIFDKLHQILVMSNYKNNEKIPDVKKWKAYMDSLPVPKDCIQEAHNKYLCKKYYFSTSKLLIVRIICIFALALDYITMLLPKRQYLDKPESGRLLFEKSKAVSPSDITPEELVNSYSEVIVAIRSSRQFGRISKEAKNLFKECKRRYKGDPFFLFLIYKELAKHSELIEKYNPEATSLYAAERNIASPVITELYEMKGRKFISFMHGDYLLQMIQAYMHFSEYYTWDSTYIEMFVKDLHCIPNQFKIYTPKKLRKKWEIDKVNPEYFCTYYFSDESAKAVSMLAEIFKKLKNEGKNCKLRPHPRWNVNKELIDEKFEGFYIENANKVSLEESLAKTKYVIGLSSTVLHEALIEGREIVIDDMTSPEAFKNLKERKYVLLQKEHILFSKLLKENNIEIEFN